MYPITVYRTSPTERIFILVAIQRAEQNLTTTEYIDNKFSSQLIKVIYGKPPPVLA